MDRDRKKRKSRNHTSENEERRLGQDADREDGARTRTTEISGIKDKSQETNLCEDSKGKTTTDDTHSIHGEGLPPEDGTKKNLIDPSNKVEKPREGGDANEAVSSNKGLAWKSTVDPASGKTYYYNRTTRETAWTLPEGAVLI